MSVRDLLTFNLFLQFSDGIISYQAFALGAADANPVVAAAMVNWGMGNDWWPSLQQSSGVVLLILIFAFRRSQRFLAKRR
jgi:hypothetical protein